MDLVAAADGTIRVHGSPELVERVLAPVLDNSWRYARSRVAVEVRRDQQEVVVRICDDGPGIDTSFGEQVFVAGVGDPDSSGAGLGLPLARRVVSTLGGTIEVASYAAPTVVEVRLPS